MGPAEALRQKLSQNTAFYPTNIQSEGNPKGNYGPIPGYPVGSTFADRNECYKAGMHIRKYAGISGSATTGAYSIVISGGYEDDQDEGDYIVYTGTGGQADAFSGKGPQVKDQTFAHPLNRALQVSVENHRPVRVIRGPHGNPLYSPSFGYRYDGLYQVERAYLTKGRSGFAICQFTLRRLPGQPPIPLNGQLTQPAYSGLYQG